MQTEFAGSITEVVDPYGVIDASLAPGLPFGGSYSFDTDMPDADADPDIGLYRFIPGPHGTWPYGMFVELGNYPFFSPSLSLSFRNDGLGIRANDRFSLFAGTFDGLPPTNPLLGVDGLSISWNLAMCPSTDPCPVDHPETPDPLTSDALLRVPPELASWPENEFVLEAYSGLECPPEYGEFCVPAVLLSVRGTVTWVPESPGGVAGFVSLFALDRLRARRATKRVCRAEG